MMGYSHTVSAAAGWLVLVETGVVQVPEYPHPHRDHPGVRRCGHATGIDHHNGSIANSIRPFHAG